MLNWPELHEFKTHNYLLSQGNNFSLYVSIIVCICHSTSRQYSLICVLPRRNIKLAHLNRMYRRVVNVIIITFYSFNPVIISLLLPSLSLYRSCYQTILFYKQLIMGNKFYWVNNTDVFCTKCLVLANREIAPVVAEKAIFPSIHLDGGAIISKTQFF